MLLDTASSNRIALVEDNEALNAVLTEFLSDSGYDVSSYQSAEELVLPLLSDIAVLDLNLPGEDGLSLARRIKASTPGIGIILLTIRSTLEDKLQGYEVGADVFLAKPVDPSELLAVIKSLLNRLSSDASANAKRPAININLTNQEMKLLNCFAQGMSYSQTATTLGVSLSTIQTHTRSLYLKLGAHSKMEATQTARKLKML